MTDSPTDFEPNLDPQEALDGSDDSTVDPPMPDDGYVLVPMLDAHQCPEGHFPMDELVVLDWPEEED